MSIQLYDLVGKDGILLHSGNTAKAKAVLNLKKLKFNTIPLTFVEIHREIPKICDQGQWPPKVPVIVDPKHDGAIWDSWKIAEYLDEAYPDTPSVFNNNKPLHLFFEKYVINHLYPHFTKLVMLDIYNLLDEPSAAYFRESREKYFGATLEKFCEDKESARSQLKVTLSPIHDALKFTGWISGENVGYSDFILAGGFMLMKMGNPIEFENSLLNAFEDDVFRSWWTKVEPYVSGNGN
ncbi:hypothetical protein BC936DRAFT_144030 [Jimgerdemannia flammicorona]|uniref:GST N-terminal domain-containing protein n=1 Tax=Jimgerdemannia flammicorona TaxID=994334 RepID=A0A433DD77_9FUNG|nr:hypothetical protein BC936DRAFT_144030 [Jimgerdemannia flammicorona]